MHHVYVLAFAASAILTAPLSHSAFPASAAVEMVDIDGDEMFDLQEALAAAAARFKQNPHGKEKYLAFVAKVFKAADSDGDGLIDATELRSPAGKILSVLLRQ